MFMLHCVQLGLFKGNNENLMKGVQAPCFRLKRSANRLFWGKMSSITMCNVTRQFVAHAWLLEKLVWHKEKAGLKQDGMLDLNKTNTDKGVIP